MPTFEYSRWDGSEEFTPQSADEIFDQFSQYLMDYGEDMLDELEQLEEDLKAHREAKGLQAEIELVQKTIIAIKTDSEPPVLRALGET